MDVLKGNMYAIFRPMIMKCLYSTMSRGNREFAKKSRIREREESRSQTFLKRNLLIFSDRILDSRVEAGMPSWAAAPEGPDTRPPAAANAFSMISFS